MDQIILILLVGGSGISMLLFALDNYNGCHKYIAALAASLIYSYNYYLEHQVVWEVLSIWFAYAFLPLLFHFIRLEILSIKNGALNKRLLLLMALTIYLMLPGIQSAPGVVVISLIFLYILFTTVRLHVFSKQNIGFIFIFISLLTLTSWYFYFSYALRLLESTTRFVSSWTLDGDAKSNWLNLLRRFEQYYGYAYLLTGALKNYYDFTPLAFVIPIVAVSSLLGQKRQETLFWALVLVGSIILVAGPNGPMSPIFNFLWFALPISIGLNYLAPFFGFLNAFALSFLFGAGLTVIDEKLQVLCRGKNWASTAGLLLITFLAIGSPYNIWFPIRYAPLVSNPNLIGVDGFLPGFGPNGDIPSVISIPEYEYSLSQFFKNNLENDERILLLPIQQYWIVTKAYAGVPLFTYIGARGSNTIYGSVIHIFQPIETSNYYKLLPLNGIKEIDAHFVEKLINALRFMRIRYIVLIRDWSPVYATSYQYNITRMELILNSTHSLIPVKSFGPRLVYRLNGTLPPKIFATIVPSKSNESTIYEFPDEIPPISNQPSVTFKLVGPSRYIVHIENATGPFLLFFSESFDDSWQLQLKTADNFTIQHVLVFGYANGWIINKTGSFQVEISYAPQPLYSLSYYANLIVWILSLLVLLQSGLLYINPILNKMCTYLRKYLLSFTYKE
ncbi:MAG: hypothetical protein QXO75_05400 [Nitrososphaerota archaeon]